MITIVFLCICVGMENQHISQTTLNVTAMRYERKTCLLLRKQWESSFSTIPVFPTGILRDGMPRLIHPETLKGVYTVTEPSSVVSRRKAAAPHPTATQMPIS